MRKSAHLFQGVWYLTLSMAALACMAVVPGVAFGADRMVLGEEFSATW